jgi:hypothetical protein
MAMALNFLANLVSFQEKNRMSATLIDLLLCGLAYVVISYFLGVWSKSRLKRTSNSDDSEGGDFDSRPPVLDLPPGISWPEEELVDSEIY